MNLFFRIVKYLKQAIANHQEQSRLAAQNLAWIALNNLYLRIERGDEKLTIHSSNTLRTLVMQTYPEHDLFSDKVREHWQSEFEKLPNWFNV